MDIPYTKVKDGVLIEVKVDPRSSRKGLTEIMDNVIKVKLTAPPVGGAANEQLIEILSKAFGVKKKSITIIKGESSRRKTIKLINPCMPLVLRQD